MGSSSARGAPTRSVICTCRSVDRHVQLGKDYMGSPVLLSVNSTIPVQWWCAVHGLWSTLVSPFARPRYGGRVKMCPKCPDFLV